MRRVERGDGLVDVMTIDAACSSKRRLLLCSSSICVLDGGRLVLEVVAQPWLTTANCAGSSACTIEGRLASFDVDRRQRLMLMVGELGEALLESGLQARPGSRSLACCVRVEPRWSRPRACCANSARISSAGLVGRLARCLDLLRHRRHVLRELTFDRAGDGGREDLGRRWSGGRLRRAAAVRSGAAGTHAGVVGSSFATDNASVELAPILRDLCRLRWPRARPFDRRNLRTVPSTFRLRRRRHSRAVPVRRDHRRRRLDAATVSDGATHVGVASDHVIESFRNDMWPGYKTSAGMDPGAARADSADGRSAGQRRVSRRGRWSSTRPTTRWARPQRWPTPTHASPRCMIVTPDKDLGQCVRGTRVVQYDRRKGEIVDEDGCAVEVRRRAGIDRRLPRARR